MSLFSIVQNRAPGPAVPQAPVATSPPVPMAPPPTAPMPGFISGTSRYLLDGVMEIPGYADPPYAKLPIHAPITNSVSSTIGPWASGYGTPMGAQQGYEDYNAGLTGSAAAEFQKLAMEADAAGVDVNDPQWIARAKVVAQQAGDFYDMQVAKFAAGGDGGPDHFYEQLAAQAAEAEKQRVDARQLANIMQANEQAKATSDWKQAQLAANTQRQNTIADTGSSAVSNFLNSIGYLSASQGPTVNFNPSAWTSTVQAGFGANPDPNAADANTPQLPGYVYPQDWGKA